MSNVVIVPGNGCSPVESANWYAWARDAILSSKQFSGGVFLKDMPDPYGAKEEIWKPFIARVCNAHTVLIGHSSGAELGMRLVESGCRIKGLILVSACVTDLGCENERESGYYSRDWKWDSILSNCDWIVQFHSNNDPFIPLDGEANVVAESLNLLPPLSSVADDPYTSTGRASAYFVLKGKFRVVKLDDPRREKSNLRGQVKLFD